MTPQAKQIVDRMKQKYGNPLCFFSEDIVRALIASECFYIMRAQDDSIAYDRVKEVTNACYDAVMTHYFPDHES